MKVLVPQTWIKGTPRGYGNKKRENEWLGEIKQALKKYRDLASTDDPVNVRYEVDFDFAVWPGDPRYGGQKPYPGTDLDNPITHAL